MFDITKLLRLHLQQIKPYSSARDEYTGKVGIFLDANENAITTNNFNRYPDPHQHAVKALIADIKNTTIENIFLGNGSDEAIDLLIRAFCEPKNDNQRDNILLMPPTYGMYEVSANINNIATISVNLTSDFQLDLGNIFKNINKNTKIIFICSPNNPSGNLLKREEIKQILEKFNGIVVIDEAYADFSSEISFVSELEKYSNLVVLQTLSKAWGLANLRLGMAFASKEIIQILNKIKPPYNINGVTQQLVAESLAKESQKNEMVKEIIFQRNLLEKELKNINFITKIYPSDANFLLVKMDNAQEIFDKLLTEKIIVRNRTKVILCDNCLRITVGTAQENEKLLLALKSFEG